MNKVKKHIILVIFIFLLLIPFSFFIVYFSDHESLTLNSAFLAETSFLIFGFSITIYSLLFVTLKKIDRIINKKNVIDDLLKSLENNTGFSFGASIGIVLLKMLSGLTFLSNNEWQLFFGTAILTLFFVSILSILDTMKALFNIMRLELAIED